ncbi:MAG: TerB N-terminal domain-containing protein [Polyangiaceae bacterium]
MTFFVILLFLSVVVTIALLRRSPPPARNPQALYRQAGSYGQQPWRSERVAPPQPARTNREAPARWMYPGERAVLGPYQIDGGMLYIGEHLPSTGRPYDPDPALIDPRLPVDARNPDHAGTGMPYWPAYSRISPRQRAAYLAWLAGGRRDATYIGYVFLFFYGLERRLLANGAIQSIDPRERDAILHEVERLVQIYGDSASFRGYALRFVDFVRTLYEVPHPPPLEARHETEFPLALRVSLGRFAAAGQAIPGGWCFAWVSFDPEIIFTTPAQRCPKEFRTLFERRFSETFGEGLTVTPGKRMVAAAYTPASEGFRGLLNYRSTLPEIVTLRGPRRKLAKLVAKCTSELDGYSRWLGRHPDGAGTLTAQALLPAILLSDIDGSEASAFLNVALSRLQNASVAMLPTTELFKGSPTKSDVAAVAAILSSRQIGIEPDVNFGAPLPKESGTVVIFRRSSPENSRVRTEYRAAALVMNLAVTVAAADGTIDPTEQTLLASRVESMTHLSDGERERLRAHLRWLTEDRPGIQSLKKRLDALSFEQRYAVADFLISVACADGRIDPAEVKVLEKLFLPLGFDSRDVHRRLHAAMSTSSSEPVVVQQQQPTSGFALPPSKKKKPADGFHLDDARIAQLERETSGVAKMLGDVFAGDEDAEAEVPIADESDVGEAQSIPPEAVGSLSPQLASFARRLAAQAIWPRSELLDIARSLELMPDGALEKLNEAALDAGQDEFAYGDDPVSINQSILEEICS